MTIDVVEERLNDALELLKAIDLDELDRLSDADKEEFSLNLLQIKVSVNSLISSIESKNTIDKMSKMLDGKTIEEVKRDARPLSNLFEEEK